ncbi:hypothetical protein ACX5I6_20000 [Arthrobacter sp. MMS24-T111]
MNHAAVAGAPLRARGESPVRGLLLAESVRNLAAFAGLGAATLSFGTSATLLSTASESPWTMAGTVAAGLWGAALLMWAVQSLRNGAPSWPRVLLRVAPVGVFLHLAAVALRIWWPGGSSRSLDGTALSAAVLELVILGCVGWLGRQTFRPSDRPAAAGPLLTVTFAAALIVAAITTPGLAATAAGQHAVPHGEHRSSTQNAPAGHHH